MFTVSFSKKCVVKTVLRFIQFEQYVLIITGLGTTVGQAFQLQVQLLLYMHSFSLQTVCTNSVTFTQSEQYVLIITGRKTTVGQAFPLQVPTAQPSAATRISQYFINQV